MGPKILVFYSLNSVQCISPLNDTYLLRHCCKCTMERGCGREADKAAECLIRLRDHSRVQ